MDDLDLDAVDDAAGNEPAANLTLEDAALAVASAFRLKDAEAVTMALRALVRVVDRIEQEDGAA